MWCVSNHTRDEPIFLCADRVADYADFMAESGAEITRLLTGPSTVDAGALLPLVYDQLRGMAQRYMNAERRNHTLQATALVHEAYARLAGGRSVEWENRAHFFAAAAEAMRRILVEHARARACQKRGGGEENAPRRRLPLDRLELTLDQNPEEILSVDEAISRLEQQDPDLGRIVRLRFFAGLSEQEVAAVLGITDRTVRREWSLAKALLRRHLEGEPLDH
ncbi:MAG: sigma-70 family RNA polymerase sigma factor [Phycisphaerales bacterium]|nr:sigma-70 family RNA polymerase sigma factor [Phycisphaerales bacterium]